MTIKIGMPRWFYQLASPKWCYEITGKLLPAFSVLTVILLLVGTIWGLAFAPPDYQQGNSFRIIYIHVPTAYMAQSIYVTMAIAGAIGLIWKMKMADMVAKVIAPLGASLTFLALVTGAIWGKPTWGTWWEWDARLTSMLILFFLYLGAIALHEAMENEASAARATAILTLVGVVNIPIIQYSVYWWNTLHQPSTFSITEKPAMPPAMWIPLVIMILGFYCYFAVIVMLRIRNEILHRERRSSWVKSLLKEKWR